MHITLIAGARPNFMKVAPLIKAIKAHNEGLQVTGDGLRDEKISYRLVHTGQHYDKNMSDTFFEELGIPAPDDPVIPKEYMTDALILKVLEKKRQEG